MSVSTCVNCHLSVAPNAEICENCGAVLMPLPVTTPTPVSTLANGRNVSLCQHCKQPVSPGDEICENCGAVLQGLVLPVTSSQPAQEICPQCHKSHVPGIKFCNHCGYSLVVATSPVDGQPQKRSQTSQLAAGSLLNGKYRIVKEIGAGGMGLVYLADDQVLKRSVVIKALLSEDDPDMVAQSVKEREFLAAIKHANIVSIYDFVTMGTQGYIVMEYVQGKTLEQMMEEQGKPLVVPDAIKYILGILPAFSYLAKLGLVYCDFKPQNVVLEVLKDGAQVVKLIDLGTVIRYVPAPADVYGTHGFYAPQAVKTPSSETDLYTVCRTLAYMVTQMDLANPIFGMPSVERYRVFRDHPALYRLLVKGTHNQPEQRFHSAEELSDQLAGVLQLVAGGKPGVQVSSHLFVSNMTTTTGKLGPRGEAALDEKDKAIDLLRYGDRALHSGNYANALNLYRQAASNNPSSIDAHLRMAEVFIEQGVFAQAQVEMSLVQSRATGNWKVTWHMARLLEAQGDSVAAADLYGSLIADLPGELPPLQALARIRAKQGDNTAAVALYKDVLRADPGNTEAILGLTDSLLNLQRWDEVAQVLAGVSEAAAKYVDAQLLLCDLYLNRIAPLTVQNIERASQSVHALAGRTEDARYYLARGDVYRAAWMLARSRQLPANTTLAGVSNTNARTLGIAAEESYRQYLRREQYPVERESIVRRMLEVTPWRLW